MSAYLQVTGLEKRFGGLLALQDCSFTISERRIACLVGPNGAGKTTIFNVITGFLKPNEGSITFRGRSLDGFTPQAVVHAGISRTFQNLRLFADLTALDNVMVALPRQFAEEPFGGDLPSAARGAHASPSARGSAWHPGARWSG